MGVPWSESVVEGRAHGEPKLASRQEVYRGNDRARVWSGVRPWRGWDVVVETAGRPKGGEGGGVINHSRRAMWSAIV